MTPETLKQQDLDMAFAVQQAIMMKHRPPFPDMPDRLDAFGVMHPAQSVGGDFFDIFPIDKNNIGFVIGDVSGMGVTASMYVGIARTAIRLIARQTKSVTEVMARVNDVIGEESINAMYVTALYGTIDINTGIVQYVNAGHTSPYILRSDGVRERLPKSSNLVLGMMTDRVYAHGELQLRRGDALVLYSDGVTEQFDAAWNTFGERRFEQMIPEFATEDARTICNRVVAAVHRFIGSNQQSDDITMLVLKMK